MKRIPWNKNKKIQSNTGKTHFKKGQTPWNKGKHLSDKHIKNLKDSHKGKKSNNALEMWREKGGIPWNKNKKGVMPIPWNKNKKLSEDHKRKLKENHKGMTGKIMPDSAKRKIGLASSIRLKGKKQSKEIIEKRRLRMLGHIVSEETRIKIGKANSKPHFNQRGDKCHLWKGNKMAEYPEKERIRKSFEYILWRKANFERDNFTCQKNGQLGGKLVVHHINNFNDFPELRLALDNGITLSQKAHIEFHKKYGKHNNTKEQIIEFLQ